MDWMHAIRFHVTLVISERDSDRASIALTTATGVRNTEGLCPVSNSNWGDSPMHTRGQLGVWKERKDSLGATALQFVARSWSATLRGLSSPRPQQQTMERGEPLA